jgi:hypothetical protein
MVYFAMSHQHTDGRDSLDHIGARLGVTAMVCLTSYCRQLSAEDAKQAAPSTQLFGCGDTHVRSGEGP